MTVCSQARLALLFGTASLLVLASASSQISASIIQPPSDPSDVEQLLAEVGEQTGAGQAENSPAKQVPDRDQAQFFGLLSLTSALPSNAGAPSSSGGSSSSSSTGASGGTGQCSLHADSIAPTLDLHLVGWTQGEARFTLPEPPGLDLLRPPQA